MFYTAQRSSHEQNSFTDLPACLGLPKRLGSAGSWQQEKKLVNDTGFEQMTTICLSVIPCCLLAHVF
jgi:hypothetical protein